jgi:hypothetical protein
MIVPWPKGFQNCSKNAIPRAKIFSIRHYLVDLHQECSHFTLGVKIGPAWGS